MYFIFNLLLLCGISQGLSIDYDIQYQDKVQYDLYEADEMFAEYVQKFNKAYDKEEYLKRLEIFKKSLRKMNKLNKEYDMTAFGINEFTDITYEEFSKCFLGVSGNYSKGDVVEFRESGYAPDALDYRQYGYVTGVKHQQSCGSCFAFSAIANIEGQYAKKYNQLVSLSEQQALDCDPAGSCDGGHAHNVMAALAREGGAMRNQDYPYEGRKGFCRTDKNKIVVKVTGGSPLGINELNLADALAQYGPLSVYIDTCYEFQVYAGGIFSAYCMQSQLHAVLLVGYGTEGGVPYWIIKNSWGSNWGEQGYIRLLRGQHVCAIGMYAACATIA